MPPQCHQAPWAQQAPRPAFALEGGFEAGTLHFFSSGPYLVVLAAERHLGALAAARAQRVGPPPPDIEVWDARTQPAVQPACACQPRQVPLRGPGAGPRGEDELGIWPRLHASQHAALVVKLHEDRVEAEEVCAHGKRLEPAVGRHARIARQGQLLAQPRQSLRRQRALHLIQHAARAARRVECGSAAHVHPDAAAADRIKPAAV